MVPALKDIVCTAHVVALPLRVEAQGSFTREAMLIEGPNGWAEFSAFPAIPDAQAVTWLQGSIDFGWGPTHPQLRNSIPVNATLPAVSLDNVESILDGYPGCSAVKVKVGETKGSLENDIARVAAARDYYGPSGRMNIAADGAWTVDEAERAIERLAEYDLAWVEQPCASVADLATVRTRIAHLGIQVAATVTPSEIADPGSVKRANAADLLVVKTQMDGGVTAALDLIRDAGLPVVISSELNTSIGEAAGVFLAASVPDLPFESGVGSAALFVTDIASEPLLPRDGRIEVRRVVPDPDLLARYAVPAERRDWWLERLRRCYALLAK